ncbi:MAG: ABC transporter permease [Candidatus Izemoplasmataceae bacterium]
MIRYTIVRTLWIFIILFVVVSINFTMLRLAPEYPPPTEEEQEIYYERQVKDGLMTRRIVDGEEMEAIRDKEVDLHPNAHYFDEDDQLRLYEPIPIPRQYVTWMSNILTDWNWGVSQTIQPNVPVFDVLRSRIPVTMMLNLVALVFYIPIGFALGIIAALKKNSFADNAISLGVMIFISIPSFVVMSLLLLTFGYQLGWFLTQYPASDIRGMARISSVFLPVLGLSFREIASLTRVTRAELSEVLTSEFLLLARTKGLTRTQSVLRHAMRNSMVPLVPGIIASFVGLLSGSVVIERIYGIPGTGRIFVSAMQENDYNLVIGITAFYTIVSLFAVLLVDLSYGLVDPRIRMGGKK